MTETKFNKLLMQLCEAQSDIGSLGMHKHTGKYHEANETAGDAFDALEEIHTDLVSALRMAAWDLGVTDNPRSSRRGNTANAIRNALRKAGAELPTS